MSSPAGKRGAFGISFNQQLGPDKVAVSDTVELLLDLSVIKQDASRNAKEEG
jgi:hypothetical protein